MLDRKMLKAEFLTLYQDCRKGSGLTDEDLAERMAAIIDGYVRTATVKGVATGAVSGGDGVPITGGLA